MKEELLALIRYLLAEAKVREMIVNLTRKGERHGKDGSLYCR